MNSLNSLRQDWRMILVGLMLTLMQAALALPTAWLLRWLFDTVLPQNQPGLLVKSGLALLALKVSSAILSSLAHRLHLRVCQRFSARLRQQLLDKVFQLPRLFFQASESGTIQDILTSEMVRVDTLARSLLSQVIPYSLISLAMALVLAWLDLSLFFIMLLLWPTIWLLNEFFRRRVVRASREYNRVYRQASMYFGWLINALDFVRTHHAEELEQQRGQKHFREIENKSIPLSYLEVDYLQIQGVLLMALSLAVLLFGGVKVGAGQLTTGSLFAFFMVVGLLNNSLREVAVGLYHVVVGQESLKVVETLLTRCENLPYHGVKPLKLQQSLELCQVSFGYTEDCPLFCDLSFRLLPGQVTALTGPNGCGKSTVIGLLLGFLAPDKGVLCADGQEYRDLDIGSLREQVGVVSQQPLLFSGSLRENLAYARPWLSDQDLWSALYLAGAEDWVKAIPEQLDMRVGEAGCRLSGGQKQKIAIARALLGKPLFLILDEPTNHLDLRAVNCVLANLRKLPQAPAILIVTHDEGVAQSADQQIKLKLRTNSVYEPLISD